MDASSTTSESPAGNKRHAYSNLNLPYASGSHNMLRVCGLLMTVVLCIGCSGESTSDQNSENVPVPTVGLLEAAQTGNIGQVRGHIAHGSKLDLTDERGMTALDYAIQNGDLKMYQMLVATDTFEETENVGFLYKHGLRKIEKLPEAEWLVEIDPAGNVKPRVSNSISPITDHEAALRRLKELTGKITHLNSMEQAALTLEVERLLISRDTSPHRRTAKRYGRQDLSREETDLIETAEKESPAIRWYIRQYQDDSFMMGLLQIAARLTLAYGDMWVD